MKRDPSNWNYREPLAIRSHRAFMSQFDVKKPLFEFLQLENLIIIEMEFETSGFESSQWKLIPAI